MSGTHRQEEIDLVREIVRTTQAKDGKRGDLRLQQVGKYKEGPGPPPPSVREARPAHFPPTVSPVIFCEFRCLVRPGSESPVSGPGCKHKTRRSKEGGIGWSARRQGPTRPREARAGDPLPAFTQQPPPSENPAQVSVEHGPSEESTTQAADENVLTYLPRYRGTYLLSYWTCFGAFWSRLQFKFALTLAATPGPTSVAALPRLSRAPAVLYGDFCVTYPLYLHSTRHNLTSSLCCYLSPSGRD